MQVVKNTSCGTFFISSIGILLGSGASSFFIVFSVFYHFAKIHVLDFRITSCASQFPCVVKFYPVFCKMFSILLLPLFQSNWCQPVSSIWVFSKVPLLFSFFKSSQASFDRAPLLCDISRYFCCHFTLFMSFMSCSLCPFVAIFYVLSLLK